MVADVLWGKGNGSNNIMVPLQGRISHLSQSVNQNMFSKFFFTKGKRQSFPPSLPAAFPTKKAAHALCS